MGAFLRKASQLTQDATLRRWLCARALGRTTPPPAFTPHVPPYVSSLELGPAPGPQAFFLRFKGEPPQGTVTLDLAGLEVTLHPGEESAVFERAFDDIEQTLALHRFAWIGDDTSPAWVAALWTAWRLKYTTADHSWPWHPYTAAERVINLLGFAGQHGLPEPYEDSWALLAAHGPAIANRLEYFGPHYTGNHLANDGRGLFRLGTALGWSRAADLGGRILLEEAKRIFGQSGVLIEGSSHYHLLLARNYALAARWAREAGRPEADDLDNIAAKARFAAGGLLLSGGLPLIGDISPDLTPARLAPQFERTRADLSADGWHRFEQGDWSLLLYAAPDGWPPMPGHGHQDLGSFELHWKGVPLIVDPGRGRYGEEGEAALYRSGAVHNGIVFSGRDPRPANRPYYAPEFRQACTGAVPQTTLSDTELHLRYPMHQAAITRRFFVDGPSLVLEDSVTGSGQHAIARGLTIPHPIQLHVNQALIQTAQGAVRLTCDVALTQKPITRWTAYGRGQAATRLLATMHTHLPWQGRLTLEAA